MKKVRVHGSKPAGHWFPLVSWLIRLFDGPASHVVIETMPQYELYHIQFNNALYQKLDDWKKKNKVVWSYEFQLTEGQYLKTREMCSDYSGKKKGYFCKLFGAAIPKIVYKLFGKCIKNTFVQGMKKNATCSEFIRHLALNVWSFNVPVCPRGENYSPSDIRLLMDENRPNKLL